MTRAPRSTVQQARAVVALAACTALATCTALAVAAVVAVAAHGHDPADAAARAVVRGGAGPVGTAAARGSSWALPKRTVQLTARGSSWS